MIEMNVMGIAIDTRTGAPIVILQDAEKRKALPIWIGSAEAGAIIRHIEKIQVARPMTHDLIKKIVEELDYTISKIEINDVNSETYYANIFLEGEGGKEIVLDARPSDAIAVAIRAEAPIFVTSNVLASGTISLDKEKDVEEAEKFKEFIKDLKPSDFQKFLKDNQESDQ